MIKCFWPNLACRFWIIVKMLLLKTLTHTYSIFSSPKGRFWLDIISILLSIFHKSHPSALGLFFQVLLRLKIFGRNWSFTECEIILRDLLKCFSNVFKIILDLLINWNFLFSLQCFSLVLILLLHTVKSRSIQQHFFIVRIFNLWMVSVNVLCLCFCHGLHTCLLGNLCIGRRVFFFLLVVSERFD